MKLDKHIYIDEDQNNQVLEYAKMFGIGYSEMMCKMVDDYARNRLQSEKLTKIENELSLLHKLVNLNYNLLEQLYSDLNLSNITNPNNSYALKEFKKKMVDRRLDG